MNKKDQKKDDSRSPANNESKGARPSRSPRTPPSNSHLAATGATTKKNPPKKSRKVKFADPVFKQLLYDKNHQHHETINSPSTLDTSKHRSTLNDLEPPLSLVAQFDLAARKLNARKVAKSTDESVTKPATSAKSFKSSADFDPPRN